MVCCVNVVNSVQWVREWVFSSAVGSGSWYCGVPTTPHCCSHHCDMRPPLSSQELRCVCVCVCVRMCVCFERETEVAKVTSEYLQIIRCALKT